MIQESALNTCLTIQFINKSMNETIPTVWVCDSKQAYDEAMTSLNSMSHITIVQHGNSHVCRSDAAQPPAESIVEPLELARILLIHSVYGILEGCGNSYANAYTENWLRHAKSLGAYHGECVGNIKELKQAWNEYAEADNSRFPNMPRHPDHT